MLELQYKSEQTIRVGPFLGYEPTAVWGGTYNGAEVLIDLESVDVYGASNVPVTTLALADLTTRVLIKSSGEKIDLLGHSWLAVEDVPGFYELVLTEDDTDEYGNLQLYFKGDGVFPIALVCKVVCYSLVGKF